LARSFAALRALFEIHNKHPEPGAITGLTLESDDNGVTPVVMADRERRGLSNQPLRSRMSGRLKFRDPDPGGKWFGAFPIP